MLHRPCLQPAEITFVRGKVAQRFHYNSCTTNPLLYAMAKKRKASGQAYGQPKSDKKEKTKLAINTFEDVADSEDEFHINRDKILLDEGPEAKRRRKWQERGAQNF